MSTSLTGIMEARAAPQPFTEQELAAARNLRIRLSHVLPQDFNHDFFLARWWRMYNGDEKALEAKLLELIEHRRAFGYNSENIIEKCQSLEFARKTFERFAISRLEMDSLSDNVAVFVQKMDGCDLKEITKVIPLSYVLHSYYLLHECFQRAMRLRELETGTPAAVVVVLDLRGLNLTDFINPLSNPSKLARLIVKIWSDYFTENMITLYLMHPPGILSLMWQIAKQIVDAKTQTRIAFVTKEEDILKCLAPESIPVEFGGKRVDRTGYANPAESCCRAMKKITPDQYWSRDAWWAENGLKKAPAMSSISLKAKSTHEIARDLKEGQKLAWEFTTSSDLTFEIVRIVNKADSPSLKENVFEGMVKPVDEEEVVWPRVTLTSLKVPEHGIITAQHAGEYRVRWGNPSGSWLNAKASVVVAVIE